MALVTLVLVSQLEARPVPLGAEERLNTKTSSFRELVVDCTERSKSVACHRAGMYYIDQRHDYQNGFEFLNNACKLGGGYSCTTIGNFYQAGSIFIKDLVKAKEYYNKGCLRESQEGCEKFKRIIIVPAPKKSTFFNIFN